MPNSLQSLKFFTTFLFIGALSLFPCKGQTKDSRKDYKVAITQIVQHPSLDKIRKGIIDELAKAGFKEGENLEILFEDAQGNIATAAQIAKLFISKKPDVIVAISTPSAQAILNSIKKTKIPLVYGAVTDPVGAKIIPSLTKTSPYATGTIDLPPVEKQVELIKLLLPKAKKIGVVYNPGEANAAFQVKNIKKTLADNGLSVVESPAAKTPEVATAAQSLIKKVDAILLPNDNTVISALDSLMRVASEAKLPVFTSDPESIERGAVGAVANDQYEVGLQTGKLVVEILKGASPSTLLSQKVMGAKVYQNKKIMKKLGLK